MEVHKENGEEHRHNYGRHSEGYGHVMLLDMDELIRPISIGPGLMKTGTDSPSLSQNIHRARDEGGRAIWCHQTLGLEDIPNWVLGALDAQNIFDGSQRANYDECFYPYLNIGLRVPFSTGTDWFIYDFSRVYVELPGELTATGWLDALADLVPKRQVLNRAMLFLLQLNGQQFHPPQPAVRICTRHERNKT